LLGIEALAAHAVVAFVLSLVDVPRVPERAEQRLHTLDVPRLRGPDEVVVGDVEALPDSLERLGHLIAVDLGIQPLLAGGLLDVGRMLVVPHEEPRVEARQPLVARHGVRGDLLVRGAQVGQIVDVIDRGGEVELGHQFSEMGNWSFCPLTLSPSPGFVPRAPQRVLSQPRLRSRAGPWTLVPAGRSESARGVSWPVASVRRSVRRKMSTRATSCSTPAST